MNVEFNTPEQFKDPFPQFKNMLNSLIGKIGKERASFCFDLICYEWGQESGYYYKKVEDKHIFVHTYLNPRDFN